MATEAQRHRGKTWRHITVSLWLDGVTAACRRQGSGALLAVVIGCLVTAALHGQAPAAMKNPVAPSAESIAAGKQTYTRSCAPCHGISGQGGPGNDLIPAAPDLTDATWDHGGTDGDIFVNIKEGIGPEFNMTPFKDRLKDEEIWNVVNYVRSLRKP